MCRDILAFSEDFIAWFLHREHNVLVLKVFLIKLDHYYDWNSWNSHTLGKDLRHQKKLGIWSKGFVFFDISCHRWSHLYARRKRRRTEVSSRKWEWRWTCSILTRSDHLCLRLRRSRWRFKIAIISESNTKVMSWWIICRSSSVYKYDQICRVSQKMAIWNLQTCRKLSMKFEEIQSLDPRISTKVRRKLSKKRTSFLRIQEFFRKIIDNSEETIEIMQKVRMIVEFWKRIQIVL